MKHKPETREGKNLLVLVHFAKEEKLRGISKVKLDKRKKGKDT